MAHRPKIVVIDDEPGVLALIERVIATTGYEVALFTSASEALSRMATEPVDVAIIDLRMPEINGLDVLRAVRDAQPNCQVVLMTADGSVESAIEAVKLGALDYLTKPIDAARLRQLLANVSDEHARLTAVLAADSETARRLELCGMIGRSPVMQELFALVRRIAPHARVALVTGETGTGKEGIARAIHDLGPRRSRRFVTINCSAVVETLFESELFGHVRGAFTGATDHKPGLFEAADGGTLFLDEIGELPASVQAKLLRVLETGEVQRVGSLQARKVDVRIVAATNRDLLRECDCGQFRRDLFYRLNVIELRVPALRERADDIPYLTAAFIREFAERFHKRIECVRPAAERALVNRAWMGNVRELRNVLERACMLADGDVLTERDLQTVLTVETTPTDTDVDPPAERPSEPTLNEDLRIVEREHIVRVLAEARGNKRAAAERLGLSRRTLYRRLERYNLMASSDAQEA
jgi:two-component system, NtrC family, response regulator HydG